MASVPTPGVWGLCTTCGAATPPGAAHCPMCGAAGTLAAADVARAPPKVRRRLRLTSTVRSLIVVGAVIGLVLAIVPNALSGPPTVADPLTTSGTYAIAPGNVTVISGEITGGDYVLGNYSTVAPYGGSVAVAVYNSTEWSAFLQHQPAVPDWSLPAQPSGRIVFSATYTDTFAFVFANPYPVGSGVAISVYVATDYQSNVANDGFG